MGVNEFSAIPLKSNYLLLKSTYNPLNTAVTVKDPMEVLRHPLTKMFVINVTKNSYPKVNPLLQRKRRSIIE